MKVRCDCLVVFVISLSCIILIEGQTIYPWEDDYPDPPDEEVKPPPDQTKPPPIVLTPPPPPPPPPPETSTWVYFPGFQRPSPLVAGSAFLGCRDQANLLDMLLCFRFSLSGRR